MKGRRETRAGSYETSLIRARGLPANLRYQITAAISKYYCVLRQIRGFCLSPERVRPNQPARPDTLGRNAMRRRDAGSSQQESHIQGAVHLNYHPKFDIAASHDIILLGSTSISDPPAADRVESSASTSESPYVLWLTADFWMSLAIPLAKYGKPDIDTKMKVTTPCTGGISDSQRGTVLADRDSGERKCCSTRN